MGVSLISWLQTISPYLSDLIHIGGPENPRFWSPCLHLAWIPGFKYSLGVFFASFLPNMRWERFHVHPVLILVHPLWLVVHPPLEHQSPRLTHPGTWYFWPSQLNRILGWNSASKCFPRALTVRVSTRQILTLTPIFDSLKFGATPRKFQSTFTLVQAMYERR